MDTERDLTTRELASWARLLLDDAYEHRARTKCSKEDFEAGFIACLQTLDQGAAFERATPDPRVLP